MALCGLFRLIIISPSVAPAIRAFLFLLHALETRGSTTANNPEFDAAATWCCLPTTGFRSNRISEPCRMA
jgi:hypothetical protein